MKSYLKNSLNILSIVLLIVIVLPSLIKIIEYKQAFTLEHRLLIGIILFFLVLVFIMYYLILNEVNEESSETQRKISDSNEMKQTFIRNSKLCCDDQKKSTNEK